jgi:hypothetical protein
MALLLSTLVYEQLNCVPPGLDPFEVDPSSRWLEGIRGTASTVSDLLLKVPEWPVCFEGVKHRVDIVLTEDDDFAYAWVGRDGPGLCCHSTPPTSSCMRSVNRGWRWLLGLLSRGTSTARSRVAALQPEHNARHGHASERPKRRLDTCRSRHSTSNGTG